MIITVSFKLLAFQYDFKKYGFLIRTWATYQRIFLNCLSILFIDRKKPMFEAIITKSLSIIKMYLWNNPMHSVPSEGSWTPCCCIVKLYARTSAVVTHFAFTTC